MEEAIKSKVDYRLLVPFRGNVHKIGNIVVDTYHGDIYYTPSQAIHVSAGRAGELIEHVSFHKSGTTSVKFRNRQRQLLAPRKPILDIGYQLMLQDSIFDISSLPEHAKPIRDIDVVFDEMEEEALTFKFSIVSGRLIVMPDAMMDIAVRSRGVRDDSDLLSVKTRCLGWHSGNADKLMQYSLNKCAKPGDKHPVVKRTLLILNEQGVSRPEVN